MRKVVRFMAWLALAAATIFLAVQLSFLARVWWWRDHNPASTAFMQARLDQLRARDREAKLRHAWVPYERISTSLKRAVVVAEDAKFSDHEGFDWEAIEKAREKNRQKGRIVAGGSTISQQLAKNLFLSGERSAWRKGQEALITVMIEHVMDKRRILEIYLNVIEWGEGVFGAEAAARHYYNVGAAQLGAEQSARLAAMVPNPRFYDRNRSTSYLARRAQTILARMPAAELP
ncbi:MAG TPA: monofunctional biosynthetic peptidoglycan transglycosylase [Usitatibacter sp.]|nr:monofunctional biosynthetic peptidoglycan transglycosylase [Usitatibacter sp.]